MLSSFTSLFGYSIDNKILSDTNRFFSLEDIFANAKSYKRLKFSRYILRNEVDDEYIRDALDALVDIANTDEESNMVRYHCLLYMAVLQLKLKCYAKAKELCDQANTYLSSDDPDMDKLKVYIERCYKDSNEPPRFRRRTKKAFAATMSVFVCIAAATSLRYMIS